MFRVVIPARHGSTRLPGKPLQLLAGKPLLQWVHQIAVASGAAEVVIATDDERILAAAALFGATSRLTSLTHLSGTDRIAEVALQAGWGEDDVVVNLQGDEPMMPPELVRQVAGLLEDHPSAAIATLATRIGSVQALLDPNAVKVVTDTAGRALYFSRAPIPWNRDGATQGLASQTRFAGAQRHLGIYAYRVDALKRMTSLPPGELELTEKLEQLRALQAGMKLVVDVASVAPPAGIDTQADLDRVREALPKR